MNSRIFQLRSPLCAAIATVSILNLTGGLIDSADACQIDGCVAIEDPTTEEMRVRTTAYTHTESDHLKHGKKTAAGTTLVSGKVNSAAADWSFLPLGTIFKIKGDSAVYHVEDYGRALEGTETIDIYRPSKSSMNSWGVRHVEIEILEMGSRDRSIRLLRGRTHAKHCRRMLERLLASA